MRGRVLPMLALAAIALLPAPASKAQTLPNTPECREYLNYAATSGAMNTLGPLLGLYNRCMNSGYKRPNNLVYCGGNTYCPAGTQCTAYGCISAGSQDCGGHACGPDQKCSQGGGCVPKDSVDCGRGTYCGEGRMCWTASEDVPNTAKKGETKCTTPEGKRQLEDRIAQQRRDRKEAAQRKQRRRQRAAEEKQRQSIQKKLDSEFSKRRDLELQMRLDANRRRIEELRKQLVAQQRGPVVRPPGWAYKQIQRIARGEEPETLPPLERATRPSTTGSRASTELQVNRPSRDAGRVVNSNARDQLSNALRPTAPIVRFDPVYLQAYRPDQQSLSAAMAARRSPESYVPSPSTFQFTSRDQRQANTPTGNGGAREPNAPIKSSWVDNETASRVLPYAQLSSDAYGDAGTSAGGYQRQSNWADTLLEAGRGSEEIDKIRKSGFNASVFVKGSTSNPQEVVIAYRGTEGLFAARDWATNAAAAIDLPGGKISVSQYDAALDLARIVQSNHPSTRIVLTGHSLGGGLASYVGSELGMEVVTFNAARNSYSHRGSNTNQINIVTPGDVVGDEFTTSKVGSGSLAGDTFGVLSTTDPRTANPLSIKGITGTHDIQGIVEGLENAAR